MVANKSVIERPPMINESKLSKYYSAIADKLNELIPIDWTHVVMRTLVDDGWSSTTFYFYNEDGKVYHWGDIFEELGADEDEFDECFDELSELNEAFWEEFEDEDDVWTSFTFDLTSDGRFKVEFDYDAIDYDIGGTAREVRWAYDRLNLIPGDDYEKKLLREYYKEKYGEKECLVADRLILLPHGTKYIETTHKYATDIENTKYMMALPSDSYEATMSFLESCEAEWNKDVPGFLEFAIIKDKIQIGSIGLYINDACDSVELGWILDREQHGFGYATEAAKAAMLYAQNELNISNFTATCDSENIASENVMKKLGMTRVCCRGGRKNKNSDEERLEYLYEKRKAQCFV